MKFSTKTIFSIVAILSCVSLACMGFSAWAISPSYSATGLISADRISNSSDFVQITSISPDFTYSQAGFNPMATNDSDKYNGSVDINITLHLSYVYEVFGSKPVKIKVIMLYSENAPQTEVDSIFLLTDNDNSSCVTAQFSTQTTGLFSNQQSSYSIDKMVLSATLNIDRSSVDSNVTVTFGFNLDPANYSTHFYQPLQSGGVSFAFRVEIQGD